MVVCRGPGAGDLGGCTVHEGAVTTSVDGVIPRPKLPCMNQNNDEPNAGMQLLAFVRYLLS